MVGGASSGVARSAVLEFSGRSEREVAASKPSLEFLGSVTLRVGGSLARRALVDSEQIDPIRVGLPRLPPTAILGDGGHFVRLRRGRGCDGHCRVRIEVPVRVD